MAETEREQQEHGEFVGGAPEAAQAAADSAAGQAPKPRKASLWQRLAQARANREPRRRHSLRAGSMALILGCWVLPIMAIITVSGLVSSHNTRQYVAEVVSATVDGGMLALRRELESAMYDALDASYIPTVRSAYETLTRGVDPVNYHVEVNTFLTQQYSRDPRLRGAFLYTRMPGGALGMVHAINTSKMVYGEVQQLEEEDFVLRVEEKLQTLGTDVDFMQLGQRLFLVRLLSLQGGQFQPYAALLLELDTAYLYDGLEGLGLVVDAGLLLNDVQMQVKGEAPEIPLEPEALAGENGGPWYRFEEGALLVRGDVSNTRFQVRYAVRADVHGLLQQATASFSLVAILAVLTLPLLVLVYVFYYRRIGKPVALLRELTTRIEEGEFGRQVDTTQLESTEFYDLGMNLNAMSARLEYQFERLYREELALRDARIKALQSQINPHFLGNTLEIINWEARLAGDVKVSRMLEALSTMLEAVLDRRHRPLVHLSEEMMYVNAYLYIIQQRLGKRLEVRQEIDPDLVDWYVPRLILQPIVENAVEHGASGRTKGVITIRAARADAGWMRLEVENDGELSEEDVQKIETILRGVERTGDSSTNIGIRNVHQRLRILYGSQSGLSIRNTGDGTTLSVMYIERKETRQYESI